jgi:hypothetical protein
MSQSRQSTEKSIRSSEKRPAELTLAKGLAEEFVCPITATMMFEPVMISGCGHLIEGRMATTLRKCPHCRNGEKIQEITVIAAPALTAILSKTLEADPTLWQEVYLDHDYLAEILRKNELKTPTGERFIKLLENNTEKNLNEKSPDGNEKGKSAIVVLASYRAGRELLRQNEKIRSLASDESKQLSINGKTIFEWVEMEKEEPEVAPVTASSSGMFASSSSSSSSSRVQMINQVAAPADTVCQRVVYGNEDGALALIRANPTLVTSVETVNDYSGRTVDDATPFQAALRAGDEVMCKKIKDIYLERVPDGQAELDGQFNAVFPRGYEVHLQEQQTSADQFERDYLNPLVDAMTNASRADLEAALRKENLVENPSNQSQLFIQLNRFREAFKALALNDKVYNPQHLQKVFEKYNAKFDVWYVNQDNPDRWLRLDLFWRQVIGFEERYMPTNYAQSFCTGLGNMVENNQPLQRILTLQNYDANGNRVADINFYPASSSSGLGADVGCYSYYAGACCLSPAGRGGRRSRPGARCVGSVFTKLMSSKNSERGRTIRPESSRRNSPGCLIQ